MMRSSTGQHWIALDHVRALAAFLVFTWHFIHRFDGTPVPFEGSPALFPFAIADEGHVGVALFMTLSGYLFAKLLDGKRIDYGAFFFNRLLRLAPLMVIAIAIADLIRVMRGENIGLWAYVQEVLIGFVDLSRLLENGVWSIVVEVHFYLLLPLLLTSLRQGRLTLLYFLAGAAIIRTTIYLLNGDVQFYAYHTILGRIDQFLFGILAFQFRHLIQDRYGLALLIATSFSLAYYIFDLAGGYYAIDAYKYGSALWIFWPAIEGCAFAALIAYYETSFSPRSDGISGFVARIGEYSYSIYLLHFFIVFHAASLVEMFVMDISNFYVACLWSLLVFIMMMPIGLLSYVFIEKPFLRMRRRYVLPPLTPAATVGSVA